MHRKLTLCYALQELQSIVVALLQALSPSAAGADSIRQLTSVTEFITPFVTDAMSLERGSKSWPGLLNLCAAVTAHYPPAHSMVLDDTEGEAIPAGVAPPVPVMPPAASGNELLSIAGRMVFASLLKRSYQHEWHMLFNSYINGKSYATFYGKIAARGPTLTIVRTLARVRCMLVLLLQYQGSSYGRLCHTFQELQHVHPCVEEQGLS